MARSVRPALLTGSLLLLCACAASPPPSGTPQASQTVAAPATPCAGVTRPALCAELLALRDRDQAVRRKGLADQDNKAVQAEVETVDRENVARVRTIIDSGGWPGKSTVGEKGSAAAWTIIQHSDPDVLARYVELMERAVEAGELDGSLYATTVDRMRVQQGRPQVYGTQFREAKSRMEPFPIENEAEVDVRRAEVGLQPLAEYTVMINEMYARPKQ